MKKLFLPLAIILLGLVACQNKSTVTASGTAILQNGRWKLTSGTLTMKAPSGKDTTLNYMVFVPVCHQDDYLKFDSNYVGYVFSGSVKCSPAEADSIPFDWQLLQNNTYMNLYNGFFLFDSVVETIDPVYHFDTLQHSALVLDTIISNDTFVELDTIWPVYFDSVASQILNINNASITNFTSTTFTLNFYVLGYYPDSTKFHELTPVYKADTFKYSLTYSNF